MAEGIKAWIVQENNARARLTGSLGRLHRCFDGIKKVSAQSSPACGAIFGPATWAEKYSPYLRNRLRFSPRINQLLAFSEGHGGSRFCTVALSYLLRCQASSSLFLCVKVNGSYTTWNRKSSSRDTRRWNLQWHTRAGGFCAQTNVSVRQLRLLQEVTIGGEPT